MTVMSERELGFLTCLKDCHVGSKRGLIHMLHLKGLWYSLYSSRGMVPRLHRCHMWQRTVAECNNVAKEILNVERCQIGMSSRMVVPALAPVRGIEPSFGANARITMIHRAVIRRHKPQ